MKTAFRMWSRLFLLPAAAAVFLPACGHYGQATDGRALPVANQDSSAVVPGNSTIDSRMGMEHTGHSRRRTVTGVQP